MTVLGKGHHSALYFSVIVMVMGFFLSLSSLDGLIDINIIP